MNKVLIIIIGFWLLLVLTACTDSVPENLVDEDIYENIFIELAIIDQLDERLLQGRTKQELRQEVYAHYGVTLPDFTISHEYYELDIDNQIERLNRINSRLREERNNIDRAETEYKSENIRRADSLRQQLQDPANSEIVQEMLPQPDISQVSQSETDIPAENMLTDGSDEQSEYNLDDFSFNTGGQYTLQVRSFRDENNAITHMEEWINRGFENAYIQEAVNSETGITWYRVRLGNLNSFGEADNLKNLINNLYNIEVWVDRTGTTN